MDHLEHATRSWCPLPAAEWHQHDHPHVHPEGQRLDDHQHPPDGGHWHLHARGVDPLDDHDHHHHVAAAELEPARAAADRPDDAEQPAA